MPLWPVNQRTPRASNVAVFRFAKLLRLGSGKRRMRRVRGSTRTIALRPPSVIHGAPSGPTITPCGADPAPSGVRRIRPVAGSSHPSSPDACAVNQTPPSRAGATSCGCDPAFTGYSRRRPPGPVSDDAVDADATVALVCPDRLLGVRSEAAVGRSRIGGRAGTPKLSQTLLKRRDDGARRAGVELLRLRVRRHRSPRSRTDESVDG